MPGTFAPMLTGWEQYNWLPNDTLISCRWLTYTSYDDTSRERLGHARISLKTERRF